MKDQSTHTAVTVTAHAAGAGGAFPCWGAEAVPAATPRPTFAAPARPRPAAARSGERFFDPWR